MSQDNLIKLACTVCKRDNYHTSKNVKKLKNRIELMKYCKYEKKTTLHKESK